MKLKNNYSKLLKIITDMHNSIGNESLTVCIFKNIEDRLIFGYARNHNSTYYNIEINNICICIPKNIYNNDLIRSINVDRFQRCLGPDGLVYYISNYLYEIKQ